MPGTVITDLRKRGAVDPGRLLAGPLRAVGLQWLEAGRSTEVGADGAEHTLYVTAGSGVAALPEDAVRPDQAERADIGVALVEGTAVVLPIGSRTVLTAGTAGMEYFHAVLTAATVPPRSAPGGAVPDRSASDHTAPGRVPPDQTSPDRTSPDRTSPEEPEEGDPR